MANENEKLNRLVAKLISDTRARQIRWQLKQGLASGLTNQPSPLATLSLRATIDAQSTLQHVALVDENRGFRLDSNDNPRGGGLLALFSPHTLYICDREGRAIKELSVTTGLNDLYAAIKDQIVGADEFIDGYLGQ